VPITVTRTTTRVDDTVPFYSPPEAYIEYITDTYTYRTGTTTRYETSWTRVYTNREEYDAYEADPRHIESARLREAYNIEHNQITRTEIVST
jgi:hypothetical protein